MLVRHLRKLAKAAATTKMTESNLALVFGPTLMQSPEAGNGTPGDMQGCQQVVLALLQMPTDLWSEAEEHVSFAMPTLVNRSLPSGLAHCPDVLLTGPLGNTPIRRFGAWTEASTSAPCRRRKPRSGRAVPQPAAAEGRAAHEAATSRRLFDPPALNEPGPRFKCYSILL